VRVLEQENSQLKLLLQQHVVQPQAVITTPIYTQQFAYPKTEFQVVPAVYSPIGSPQISLSPTQSPTQSPVHASSPSSSPSSPRSVDTPSSPTTSEDCDIESFLAPLTDTSNDSTISDNFLGDSSDQMFTDVFSWSNPTSMFTTGALCLLVMLFSFGLYIGGELPGSRGPLGADFIVPSTSRGLSSDNSNDGTDDTGIDSTLGNPEILSEKQIVKWKSDGIILSDQSFLNFNKNATNDKFVSTLCQNWLLQQQIQSNKEQSPPIVGST